MKKEQLYEVLADIDDKYITEAHVYSKKSRPVWIKWAAMAACLCIVVAGVIRIGIGIFPSNVGDIYRQGVLVEIDSISHLPAEFNRKLLVENMVFSDNVWIELYHSEKGNKSNPDDWYSLLISDYTKNNEVLIHCMFGDSTVDDWKIEMVFTKETTTVKNINGVDVQIASLTPPPSYEYWNYAIFEYDSIVYDVRVKSTEADEIDTVLNELLQIEPNAPVLDCKSLEIACAPSFIDPSKVSVLGGEWAYAADPNKFVALASVKYTTKDDEYEIAEFVMVGTFDGEIELLHNLNEHSPYTRENALQEFGAIDSQRFSLE